MTESLIARKTIQNKPRTVRCRTAVR